MKGAQLAEVGKEIPGTRQALEAAASALEAPALPSVRWRSRPAMPSGRPARVPSASRISRRAGGSGSAPSTTW